MAKYSMMRFIREQFADLPLARKDLSGKRVMITGGNSGLGLEAARHLASMKPAKLILACRNPAKGHQAAQDISQSTGFKDLDVRELDLSSFASVQSFADKYDQEDGQPLDILIESAGMIIFKFELTADKQEKTLQVNHLSNALLAVRLLPYLAKSNDGRVVVVSSSNHFDVNSVSGSKKEHLLEALSEPEHTNPMVRYNETKLFNVFFVRAFADHLVPRHVVAVDCVNPGLCHSQLMSEAPAPVKAILGILKALIARSTEKGSRTLVHAALSGSQSEVNGKYLNKCQVEEESDYVLSDEGRKLQARLWDETIALLEQVDPHTKEIINTYLSA